MSAETPGKRLTIINNGRGTIRVHREGCADIRRRPGATGWNVEVRTLRELVIEIYDGFEGLEEDGTGWENFIGDLDVMPCAGRFESEANPMSAEKYITEEDERNAQYASNLREARRLVAEMSERLDAAPAKPKSGTDFVRLGEMLAALDEAAEAWTPPVPASRPKAALMRGDGKIWYGEVVNTWPHGVRFRHPDGGLIEVGANFAGNDRLVWDDEASA